MELVIAEKPSVARDLARVLGVRASKGEWLEDDRYAITWCVGHLVELDEPASYDPAWKPWRLERLPMLPAEFRLRPSQHAKGQLRAVATLLKDKRFTGVVNACDAGREGELIFRYVYQFAKSRLPVRRLWISSLTDDAIRRGFAALRPGRDYDTLAAAAYSRSEADWLVGMNATRAVTTRSRSGGGSDQLYSIGRVQTPTLALIVRREDEIRAFTPRPYWEVRGELTTEGGDRFSAPWRSGKLARIAAADVAEQIVARDRVAADARVVAVQARTVREPAPQLFDLTSLQRTANRRFGFSAARTLEIAQALYERHKVITYPRTDSRHLSRDVADQLPALFEQLARVEPYAPFARRLVEQPPRPGGRIVDDSKVSDHHAIIPTGASRSLDHDEARLFDLIVRRFLGAFFPDAEIAVTEAWIRVGAGDGPPPPMSAVDRETFVEALPPAPDHYFARGRVRMVAGWQEVAGIDAAQGARGGEARGPGDKERERDDDPSGVLPPLVVGQRLGGTFSTLAKQTTPPSRHTEATLLAAMESAGKHIEDEALRAAMKDVGLGTPATRASIIETLLRRRYIVREKQHLVPTPTGIGLIRTLVAVKVATLASPELTGSWEARLARVARGEESRATFMADIARYIVEVIDAIRGASGSDLPPSSPSSPAPSPAPSSSSSSRPSSPSSSSSSSSSRPSSPSSSVRSTMSRPSAPTMPTAAKAAMAPRASKAPGASKVPTAAGASKVPTAGASKVPRTAGASKLPRAARTSKPPAGAAKPPRAATGSSAAKPARAARAPASSTTPSAVACPHCRQGTVIAGNRGWGCSRWREGCKFVIWFERAARDLSPAQLQAAIAAQ